MEIRMKHEPIECIYCNSSDIKAEIIDPEPLTRRVDCVTCGKYWDEIFNFDCVMVPNRYMFSVLELELA